MPSFSKLRRRTFEGILPFLVYSAPMVKIRSELSISKTLNGPYPTFGVSWDMLKSSRRRVLLGLSLILAGTAIAVASLTPRLQLPGVGDGFDLGFHGAAYGTLVILGGILGGRLRWLAVAVLLYSTLLEGLQYFVPGCEIHLSDLAANAIGVFAGLAIVALWRRQQAVPEPEDKVL